MTFSTADGLSLDDTLEELSAAEDFLNFFGIGFDSAVVHVNRLHIMQRFRDYLQQGEGMIQDAEDEAVKREIYARLLQQAYNDFVSSDALTEKVFKVFQQQGPQTTFVPLDQLLGG